MFPNQMVPIPKTSKTAQKRPKMFKISDFRRNWRFSLKLEVFAQNVQKCFPAACRAQLRRQPPRLRWPTVRPFGRTVRPFVRPNGRTVRPNGRTVREKYLSVKVLRTQISVYYIIICETLLNMARMILLFLQVLGATAYVNDAHQLAVNGTICGKNK